MFEPTWRDMLVYGAAAFALWAAQAPELWWIAVMGFLIVFFIEKEVKRLARLTAELRERIEILEDNRVDARASPWGSRARF